MLLVANLANTKVCKNLQNDWNPSIWVLIWEHSSRAIQWIPTWQGFDCFQRFLHPCAFDESSLSIGRVKSCLHVFSSNGCATSEDMLWKLDALQSFIRDLHWPEEVFAEHLDHRLKLMAADMIEAAGKR